MKFETISYLDLEGNLAPGFKHDLKDETLIRAYKIMQLTRRIDERMITLQRQGVVNFVIGSRGEEGCSVASAMALQPDDLLYFQYREQGAILWRGLTPEEYAHHMLLNEKDPSKGRQMSNHYGSKPHAAMTVSSTLATQIPQAAGAAYAMKIRKLDQVSLCYFAEGAASEGDFHAGLNFAAVYKAPVIFFCRNNHYAISTPRKFQYAGDGIAPRGVAYGMPTFRVDGNDVFAVYDITKKARELCLRGEGPVLIEAMTYRVGPHSTADDPTRYRKDQEVCDWDPKCPVLRLKLYLIKKGLWNDEKDKAFKEGMHLEVEQAIETARNTPKPSIETMFQDVYADIPWNLQEQYDFLKEFEKEKN